jgi:hypothetical protein
LLFTVITLCFAKGNAQSKLKNIPLPISINGINEEYSGITLWNGRVYLLPQYGSYKETKPNGDFNIYSILADSINRVIEGKDTALTQYKTIKVKNIGKLPDIIKQNYQGMESITIVNGEVYLAIETTETFYYCYLIKGRLNILKNEITIDPIHYLSLRRYPYIQNAGFESVTYLPKEKKLLAYYEFNAMPDGGIGYLIDPAFKKPPQQIKAPFLYFRTTDITATHNDRIYGINYYWNGDYNSYLNNGILSRQEPQIKKLVPGLRDSLNHNPDYLKHEPTTYARIVTMKNYKAKQWQQVVAFDGFKNDWEGITLFKKGALIITDANRNKKQVTTLAYIAF